MAGVYSPTYIASSRLLANLHYIEDFCIFLSFRATLVLGQHAPPPLFGRCRGAWQGQFLSDSCCTKQTPKYSKTLATVLKLWATARSGGRWPCLYMPFFSLDRFVVLVFQDDARNDSRVDSFQQKGFLFLSSNVDIGPPGYAFVFGDKGFKGGELLQCRPYVSSGVEGRSVAPPPGT